MNTRRSLLFEVSGGEHDPLAEMSFPLGTSYKTSKNRLVCIYTCMYICVCIYTYLYLCVYIYMYVYMCIYTFIYI